MISVIIPLYNKEKIIERTLRSVLSQDYDDFEVVIVDDGSTDDSLLIVQEFKKLNALSDDKLKIIKQQNGGPSKARNKGIKAAIGEWLYFIDADDEMLPGALRHFIEAIDKCKHADMFIGEVMINDGKEKKIYKEYKEGIIENPYKLNFIGKINQCSGTSIYRKELCLSTLYNEDIKRFEDLEMLYRRYKRGKLYAIPCPVAQINAVFASASNGRIDIREDFLGHLEFNGKKIWEKMCLYKLFLGERPYYPEQAKKLYPWLYKRLDYYLLYQFLTRTKILWI